MASLIPLSVRANSGRGHVGVLIALLMTSNGGRGRSCFSVGLVAPIDDARFLSSDLSFDFLLLSSVPLRKRLILKKRKRRTFIQKEFCFP